MYGKQTERAIGAMSRLAEVWDGGKTRLSAFEIAEFNRSASREVDRFVYRLMRVKPPAAAQWRGLGALAFMERAKAADPNGGETGETPP